MQNDWCGSLWRVFPLVLQSWLTFPPSIYAGSLHGRRSRRGHCNHKETSHWSEQKMSWWGRMCLVAKRITRIHGGHACCTHAVGAGMHFWFILQLRHGASKLASEISTAKESKGQIPKELCNNKNTSFFPLSDLLPQLSRHEAFLLTEGQTDSYPSTFTYCSLQKIPVLQIACQRKSWMITEGYDTVRTVTQCVSSALQGCSSLRLASLEEH